LRPLYALHIGHERHLPEVRSSARRQIASRAAAATKRGTRS